MIVFTKRSFIKNLLGLILFGLLLSITSNLQAQNQSLSDSLKIVFRKNTYKRVNKLSILEKIAQSETSTDEIIIYSKELIESAKEMDSLDYVYAGYLQMGNAYRLKSDLTTALENYFIALNVAVDEELTSEQGSIKIAIADVYSIMGDSKNAVRYYKNSIDILKQSTDTIDYASANLNLGDEYFNQQKLDSALYHYNESGRLFKAMKYELGEAYNLGNVGLVYAEKGENIKAEENLNQAIKVLTELEDFYPICVYLNAMSDIYFDKKEAKKAVEYAQRSLDLAEEHGLKEQISDGFLKLSNIYEKKSEFKKSFELYKNHIIYRDSVYNINAVQKMADEEKKFEVQKKQAEVDLLNQQKKTQTIIAIAIAIALLLIALLAFSLYKRNKFVVKTSKIIESEKQRSDNLLKNILPDETAEELKEKGSVAAKKFDSVSVLFTDFKGFTQFSEGLSPEELVKSIDFYFSKFDEIMEKHGLEKIKTVGDAYMCAGGLPFASKDHPYKITLAALDIVDFVEKSMNNVSLEKAKLAIRVGINTGSVVAGVVGTKKFAYDIWGDSVNVASRMESSGAVGRVNISEATYQLIKNYKEFEFEARGAIEAKGKGKIHMYFVNRVG